MVRGRGTTWAATSVPEVRARWAEALHVLAGRYSAALDDRTERSPEATPPRLARLKGELADTVNEMTAEAAALSQAEMYWVSREMTDLAVGAADGLPGVDPGIGDAGEQRDHVLGKARRDGRVCDYRGQADRRGSLGCGVVVAAPRRGVAARPGVTVCQEAGSAGRARREHAAVRHGYRARRPGSAPHRGGSQHPGRRPCGLRGGSGLATDGSAARFPASDRHATAAAAGIWPYQPGTCAAVLRQRHDRGHASRCGPGVGGWLAEWTDLQPQVLGDRTLASAAVRT